MEIVTDVNDLKNIVYHYYPKGIDAFEQREEYLQSEEYLRLSHKIKSQKSLSEDDGFGCVFKRMSKETELTFEDNTLFSWEDRCYNFQLLLHSGDNIRHILCLNISILGNYYSTYILELMISNSGKYRTYDISRLENLANFDYGEYIEQVDEIVSNCMQGYVKLGEDILNTKIGDVSFQDIVKGDFTYFNALFLNRYYTKFQ